MPVFLTRSPIAQNLLGFSNQLRNLVFRIDYGYSLPLSDIPSDDSPNSAQNAGGLPIDTTALRSPKLSRAAASRKDTLV